MWTRTHRTSKGTRSLLVPLFILRTTQRFFAHKGACPPSDVYAPRDTEHGWPSCLTARQK